MSTKIFVPSSKHAIRQTLTGLIAGTLFFGMHSAIYAQVGIPSAWGWNSSGQIGNGNLNNSLAPFSLANVSAVVQVSQSGISSYVRKSDGSVWAWGANGVGQLGNGTTIDHTTPIKIPSLSKIGDIAASSYHALAVKSNGTVWAWGRNDSGQLGDGTSTDALSPVQVSGITKAVKVSTGSFHSLVLKSDGTVWAWGYNGYGELGNGTTTSSNTPVQVLGLTNTVQITAGKAHSMALKADGTVWAWGSNQIGQFGDGTLNGSSTAVQIPNLNNVIQIAAGGYHTLFLKQDGTVWATGFNSAGQLGDGNTLDTSTPQQVSGLSNVLQISAGEAHSLALKSGGSVWGWGRNIEGELGDGTTNSSSVPVQSLGLTQQTMIATGFQHSLSVQALQTASKLSASNQTFQYSQPIQLSVVLKNGANGLPLIQETVNITLDGNIVGSATTNSAGKAVIMVANPQNYTVGSHTIGATFLGDALFTSSTPAVATLNIVKANTAVTAKTVSSYFGATANIKAYLTKIFNKTALSGISLTFKLDGTVVGQAATDGTGFATLPYKINEPLAVGDHSVSVEFGGNSNFNASAIQSKLTILQTPTKLSGFHAVADAGTNIPFKIKLTRRPDALPLANKTIRMVIAGSQIASGVTDGTGFAKMYYLIPSNMAAGDYTVTLFFDGDANYRAESHSISVLTIRP